MNEVKNNDIIKTVEGKDIRILGIIAEGGQGYIYRVEYENQIMALKWYTDSYFLQNDGFYENLINNSKIKSPAKAFIWLEAVTEKLNGSFGYLMDLCPEGYYELKDVILSRKKPIKSFAVAADICINLVSAFRCLHNMGLVYHCISEECIFVNPTNGDIKIIGVDNVTVAGANTGIMGNPRFLAPENILGEVYTTQSARYSISVIIFLILLANHPLEGKKWINTTVITYSVQKELYGTNPLFIFDPLDDSNRPSNKLQKHTIEVWNYLPEYLKSDFSAAFSKDVLSNPNKRISEIEWLKTLTRFRSDIVICTCGNTVFLKNSSLTICDNCGKTYNVNHFIELPLYTIPATQGTRIYRCQLGWCPVSESIKPVGQIVRKKDESDLIGYRNMLDDSILIHTLSNREITLAPKKIMPITEPFSMELFGTIVKVR